MNTSFQHTWQQELRQVIRKPQHLLELLELPLTPTVDTQKQDFSLHVPKSYVNRMRKGDPQDPLLRQVLPSVEEHILSPSFGTDPLDEATAEKVPSLFYKYQKRVLLIPTTACAIHCRYCFRRHYTRRAHTFCQQTILDAIRADPSINEVILSGGDPLILEDEQLVELTHNLSTITHVQRLRLHTRFPIVLPDRINDNLLNWLTRTRLQTIIVVHTNHANELDKNAGHALQALVQAGIVVLNQSVLLKGVNDTFTALATLSEELFSWQVLPYYLHILDRVQGATHFEVPVRKAIQLVEQLRIRLPGYLVPKLVQEIPGVPYKKPL